MVNLMFCNAIFFASLVLVCTSASALDGDHPDISGEYFAVRYSESQWLSGWHFVNITKNSEDLFTWSNLVGVQWKLARTRNEPLDFNVQKNSVYFGHGHRVARVAITSLGIAGIFGPFDEFYKRRD